MMTEATAGTPTGPWGAAVAQLRAWDPTWADACVKMSTNAPGTRRHIHNALQAGATMEEITEVLELCVAQGVAACDLGVPILAEELARHRDKKVGRTHE
jgi:alkylhydroperoxidase/carboxymuconolactone decarboxylase family protein YurZ